MCLVWVQSYESKFGLELVKVLLNVNKQMFLPWCFLFFFQMFLVAGTLLLLATLQGQCRTFSACELCFKSPLTSAEPRIMSRAAHQELHSTVHDCNFQYRCDAVWHEQNSVWDWNASWCDSSTVLTSFMPNNSGIKCFYLFCLVLKSKMHQT